MTSVREISSVLSKGGFIAADEEASLLLAHAAGDTKLLRTMVKRRLTGEPLAWITGTMSFCEIQIQIQCGVYVPRPQSELIARQAVNRLPPKGMAIDLCTGSGAISKVLTANQPEARVVASDIDEQAVRCAAVNGVEVYCGDLFEPLPTTIKGQVDVVVAVPPYVPTDELVFLQRDTFEFESTLAYDGGPDGTVVLRRIVRNSVNYLRPGGTLLLELGGQQDRILLEELIRLGYSDLQSIVDDDGDLRGLKAIYRGL